MQLDHNDLLCDGATICGRTFRPNDDDSQYAVFKLDGLACGCTVEKGRRRPYLRLTPSVQVPKSGREGFPKWQFDHDDDLMMDLRLDKHDGEVTFQRDLPSTRPEDVEPVLTEALAWIQGSGYPALMGYVRECWA